MTDQAGDRRDFLKLAAGAAIGSAALTPAIAQALALPAARVTGTIRDVEHVVILMQENRSFDHYFGTLAGVRGYGDPRPIQLPSGDPVWLQPGKVGAPAVGPFHLDSDTTRAQTMFSLDHSWKGTHARWKHHDAWIPAKGPLTMGYFTRADLPFYYALADAFTVCDAYHCSIWGPTNPNRLFLFSGTSGLSAGDDSKIVVQNPPDETNETADPAKDSKTFPGLTWPTYAERLQAAGVSWRLYQEFDNYGDNGLAYFKSFRGIGPESVLYQQGRAWVPGSNAPNAKTSNGEHLIAAFAADVAADRLPQVSWIVPPYKLCEHPDASPAAGEWFTARLIAALTANPKVWAKTVFILNYDENDGFFDHAPPPIPAVGSAKGKSTVATSGEDYHGESVGLGPRVPMIVVSPWTKGGFVNSQVFDHTSVIQFLDARFGVQEPNISPWRRTVTGDLTSVFDFKTPNRAKLRALPDASGLPARADRSRTLPFPKAPATPPPLPRQEPGGRRARALPYDLWVEGGLQPEGFALALINRGRAGAALNLYPRGPGEPRFYTVGVGAEANDLLPVGPDGYAFDVHGPNGYLRSFRGPPHSATAPRPELFVRFDPASRFLALGARNLGSSPVTLTMAHNAYLDVPIRTVRLDPGDTRLERWDLKASANWYDLIVTSPELPGFQRRFAGHGEDGRPSVSDPLLGRQA
jgi:phospholipase C